MKVWYDPEGDGYCFWWCWVHIFKMLVQDKVLSGEQTVWPGGPSLSSLSSFDSDILDDIDKFAKYFITLRGSENAAVRRSLLPTIPWHWGGCGDLEGMTAHMAKHLSLDALVVTWNPTGVQGSDVAPSKGKGVPVYVKYVFYLYQKEYHWKIIHPHPRLDQILGV